ncbi:uncharacterized protein V1516DRAFT_671093 [Lipomyces oligophaga]|uniref:uncharacterized protein n=1 Tax=Lipomyces oligophaga TaxID=45792 RepID=UPI0034CEE66B
MSAITLQPLLALRDRFVSLPYLTAMVCGVMTAYYGIALLLYPDFPNSLALDPARILTGSIYRLLTYPLVHQGLVHLVFNVFALVPVLSSFEEETGTVGTAGALLLFTLIPAVLYVFSSFLLNAASVPTLGASGWVFSLMAYFALKDQALRPSIYFTPTIHIPTWTTPIITLLVIAVLLPGSSFLGHLFGLVVGYLYGLGYLNSARLPPLVINKLESHLAKYNLNKALPRFISDESASKHRVVFDSSIDAGVPSGSTSPVLGTSGQAPVPSRSAFIGQGKPLGS